MNLAKDEIFIGRYDASVVYIKDEDEVLFGEHSCIDGGLFPSPLEDTVLKMIIPCAASIF